jgi:opine dehydrogenase
LVTDVHIVSNELNSYFAGLVLAGRGFRVAIAGRPASSVDVDLFGVRRTVDLVEVSDLDADTRLAVVAAEGEDLHSGVAQALEAGRVDLLLIVGGGTAGVVDASRMIPCAGIDAAKVLVVSAFIWGGIPGEPVVLNSEKLGLLSGYLDEPSPETAALGQALVPTARIVDIATVGLASMNAIVHPVPMILGATEIERGVESRFFIDTFGAGVSDVVARLDAERVALGHALGRKLPTFTEMLDTYYADEGISGSDVRERVNTFRAYQNAIIPHTFAHRYLTHEVAGNLAPMARLGALLGVDTPVMNALVTLGTVLSGVDLTSRADDTAAYFLQLACEGAESSAEV